MVEINRELIPIKTHYFLYNAATGPIVPFLPLIAKQLGFTGILVGLIYTILPISGLIAKPLFGGLADKFKMHRLFIIIFQIILTIAFFSIYFIPELPHSTNVQLDCHETEAFVEVCSAKKFTNRTLNDFDSMKSTASCHFSCESSSKIYEVLCKKWEIKQYCGLINTNATESGFEFTGMFNKLHHLEVKNCVYLKLMNVSFSSDSVIHHPNCKDAFFDRVNCTSTCPQVPEIKALYRETNNAENESYQFHLFLWAAVISWVGMAVVVSISDAICIDVLGNNQSKYGRQKMFGSIGFGLFGVGAGYLVDVFSRGQEDKDYSCIFYIMLITMIFDILVTSTLKKKSVDHVDESPSILWELGSVAKERRVLVFAFWCIGAGICTGVVWNFLFWYTETLVTGDDRQWLKTIQGLLTGIQCFLGELPFNFLSDRILIRLGHINVMSLVLLTYAIRFMAYSLIANPWLFLFSELLHGPTFGLCWPTMVAYGEKIAPTGTRATMQGFVGAVFEGIGVAFGSLICGYTIENYGGIITFRAFSIGALAWLAVYWILQLLLKKAKAYPIYQGHNHLATYATPDDAMLMTVNQELQTY